MDTNGIRWLLIVLSSLGAISCGGGGTGAGSCAGTFESSCDVATDNSANGAHTCVDYVAISAAANDQSKTWCTNPTYVGGTVLSGCCSGNGVIARCVFTPSDGGTATEWFYSGGVAAAQSRCTSQGGTFTAF